MLDWPNLIAGALLGTVLGILGTLSVERLQEAVRRRKLRNRYGCLSGNYSNWRNGKVDTRGTIHLEQENDGHFEVTALHESGEVEWKGKIWMSLESENQGTGTYRHEPAEEHGFGDQLVRYFPEDRTLHVVGKNRSSTTQVEFVHVWKRLER